MSNMKNKVIIAILASFLLVGVAKATEITIKPGDTLWGLFGNKWKEIAQNNNIIEPKSLQIGQKLQVNNNENILGNGYVPVTGYESRTTGYITASATTIPVASTKDKSGQQIDLSNISSAGIVKVYMNLEPGGTNEEPIVCTGVTSVSWTGCTRGLVFQGSSESASTTLQKAHNAGSKIIITNIGQFYNQYVSVDGTQTINGVKTFTTFPIFNTSTQLCTLDGQFCTKYYIDNVGASGFTTANVSTTRGLSVDGSAPERVGINASSTTGMSFDSNGKLYQAIDPTLKYESNLLKVNTSTIVSQIATSTPTANKIPIANASGKLDDTWLRTNCIMNVVAGETINGAVTPQPIYLNTSDTLYYLSSALFSMGTSTITKVDGFAISNATSTNSLTVKTCGLVNGFTGLVTSSEYILSVTPGGVSTTPSISTSTIANISLGTAVNSTQLLMNVQNWILPNTNQLTNQKTNTVGNTGGVYQKATEMIIGRSGYYNTFFQMEDTGGGSADNARIYKNGVAYGTDRSYTVAASFSEDLIFKKGDLFQIYIKSDNSSRVNFALLRGFEPIGF